MKKEEWNDDFESGQFILEDKSKQEHPKLVNYDDEVISDDNM